MFSSNSSNLISLYLVLAIGKRNEALPLFNLKGCEILKAKLSSKTKKLFISKPNVYEEEDNSPNSEIRPKVVKSGSVFP